MKEIKSDLSLKSLYNWLYKCGSHGLCHNEISLYDLSIIGSHCGLHILVHRRLFSEGL
jgi:hypothetical protein